MKKNVWLTDTTLRDGLQSPGMALCESGRLRIAALLDRASFCQIEAGIPAKGAAEKDMICRMMDSRRNAKIAVWNRMRMEDIRHSMDCRPDVIHISAPASDTLITSVLKKDRAWVRKTLRGCVDFARGKGYEVTVGLQDVSRADMRFVISLLGVLEGLGVSSVRLADTVGIWTPLAARKAIKLLAESFDMDFGIHTHNDLGMAVAIAVEAVKAGVKHVDTTLFGIGERAGNCDSMQYASSMKRFHNIQPQPDAIKKILPEAAAILFNDSGITQGKKFDTSNEESIDTRFAMFGV